MESHILRNSKYTWRLARKGIRSKRVLGNLVPTWSENKGHTNHIEGKLNHVATSTMSYEEKLLEIQQDLQSSISYGGGEDLNVLKDVRYVEV